jgi:hypothetical protein
MTVGSRGGTCGWWLLQVWLASACTASAPVRREENKARVDGATQRKSPSPVVQLAAGEPVYPRFECMEFGCPASVRCGKAHCVVTHCGRGDCRFCPAPFPEALKSLVVKEWCVYGCLAGTVPWGSAYGFVSSLGKTFVGPLGCPDGPPASETHSATLGEE